MGLSINDRLTDKYENEFLPTCNFPLHHHIKQTSLRSLKSISRKKTLEHLPKSKDAMIHLTVVEVPSPDVTVGVSKSRLCVRAETGFYPAENIEVDFQSLMVGPFVPP